MTEAATPVLNRRTLVAACGVGFASGWCMTNIGAIASEVSASYRVSLATVGLFTTAVLITHMLTQVPGGRACDRFGAQRVALLGLGVIVLANGLALIASDPALGLGARVLTGIGTGLGFIAGSAYVRASGGSAYAQGLFGGIALASGGVALALVPQLEAELSWRAPYLSAIAIALIAIALLQVAPADTEHLSRTRDRRPAGLFRDPRLRRLAVVYSASLGLSLVIGNWVVEILQRQAGASSGTAGAVGALTLLLSVLTRPYGGWLLHRHPNVIRPAVAGSLLAGAVGTVAILIAEPLWVAALGGLLIGVGAGIPFSPSFTGAAAARPDSPAGAVGLVNGSAAMTALVGTPLLGLTFSLPGDGRIGFAAVAALWLVAMWLVPSRQTLGA